MGRARRDDSHVARIRNSDTGVGEGKHQVVSVDGVNTYVVNQKQYIFGHVPGIVEVDSIDSLYSYAGCSRCHDIRCGDPLWRAR